MDLLTDITKLKGVGEKSSALFAKLNIETCKDLLLYFPRSYTTYHAPKMISDTKENEICALRVMFRSSPVIHNYSRGGRSRSLMIFTGADASGEIRIRVFNQPYLKNVYKAGHVCLLYGTVKFQKDKNGIVQYRYMDSPKLYKEEEYLQLMKGIQPTYPLTKNLTNNTVTKALRQLFEHCEMPKEFLPDAILREAEITDYANALRGIHFPESESDLAEARNRLVFQEFLFFVLMLRNSKAALKVLENEHPMIETAETSRFLESLPFKLTSAQKRVIEEIKGDMTSGRVMSRLVQGDVGSGKTIVAFWALLLCVSNGYQGAMMAPTEVLAKQHYQNLCELCEKYRLPIKPALLTGSQSAALKKQIYAQISTGEVNVVIGTHAIIQDKVVYKNLALVVTDEQHRFGVGQRETLKEKGKAPHVLVMSATPIPRTLALIVYGDLCVSVMDELPGGRKAIKNCVVGTDFRPKAYKFIEDQINAGRQAYVICPMVEEGELENAENVIDYTETLRDALPENIRVSYLHGKMKPAEKIRIMEEFSAGNIDVLVSTTVIEVGVDVPNATVIMIENAERFGLAQLHQLRGRVGRGKEQSYCIFLNTGTGEETKKRLEILNRSNDGFKIAEEDLKLRGPGELFGVRQSGDFRFKLGDLYADSALLRKAAQVADKFGEELKSDSVITEILSKVTDGYVSGVDFTTI